MLKLTIEHITDENQRLKQQVNDLKITIKTNKEVMSEYMETITDKNSAVKKLMEQIELMKARFYTLESQSNLSPRKRLVVK